MLEQCNFSSGRKLATRIAFIKLAHFDNDYRRYSTEQKQTYRCCLYQTELAKCTPFKSLYTLRSTVTYHKVDVHETKMTNPNISRCTTIRRNNISVSKTHSLMKANCMN